jgi:predicted kinase
MIDGVALFVISGVSAAGKSTVARLLAGRFERGVCVPGDAIRAMVISGRHDMRPGAGSQELRQLVLRYAGALAVASVYLRDGYDVVVEDGNGAGSPTIRADSPPARYRPCCARRPNGSACGSTRPG